MFFARRILGTKNELEAGKRKNMADAAKNRLPSGYDEEFVNAVEEDFQCLICHLPLKEPVQTRCGHRFCKECLEEHFRRQGAQNKPFTCPADREGLDQKQDVFPDKATARKILSFVVKCPTKSCGWTGELRNKQNHMESCPDKRVQCTNEKCPMMMLRRNLQQHVTTSCQWRLIDCEHCSEPHPKCQMKEHLNKCSKFLVTCPNSCGSSIVRKMVPNHTKNYCPLSFISCPYEQIGCKRKLLRREVDSHLQSAVKPHLDLACAKLKDTEEKLETRVFVWKINNFIEAKTGGKKCLESAPFYSARTESYGYKLRVKIDPNGFGPGMNTHLSVSIYVMKGEYDAILPWPFKKKVKFTLIDQQEDSVERENVSYEFIPGNYPESYARPTQNENSTGCGCSQFISHEKLHSRRYLVENTLFLQVEVGP